MQQKQNSRLVSKLLGWLARRGLIMSLICVCVCMLQEEEEEEEEEEMVVCSVEKHQNMTQSQSLRNLDNTLSHKPGRSFSFALMFYWMSPKLLTIKYALINLI